MFTHTHIRGITAAGLSITKRAEVTGEQEINISASVSAGTTNGLHALTIDVSQLKSLFIVADGDLTLETNSGSSPANTITLQANEPFAWATGVDGTLRDTGGTAITTDITGLYVTNAGAAAVTLQFFALVDPTV